MTIWQNLFTHRATDEAAWRRFAIWLLAIFGGGIAFICAGIVLTDPYDSGRLLSIIPGGTFDSTPRTANVSRGRDASFNSAIVGNSHIQLVDPQRLSLPGLNFVQLSTPGTGPREQIAIMQWFLRNHRDVGAVVIGMDDFWCTDNPEMPLTNPFPFWLYGDFAGFTSHLLSSRSLDLMARRVAIAAGLLQRTVPNGYWDYEAGRVWDFKPDVLNWKRVDLSARLSGNSRPFPAFDLLENAAAQLPKKSLLIAVFPPRFRAALPEQETQGAIDIANCKAEFIRRFRAYPNVALIDLLIDNSANRNPANYMDMTHYRAPIARAIEMQVRGEIENGLKPQNNGKLRN